MRIGLPTQLNFALGPLVEDRVSLVVGNPIPRPSLLKGAEAAITKPRSAFKAAYINARRFDHGVLRHRSGDFHRHMGERLEPAQHPAIESRVARLGGDYRHNDAQVSRTETPKVQICQPVSITFAELSK